jgi:glycosyltransferase involved in cell wall biosynthesis
VYNGERFISKCLDSIIDQDNGKIEIILVDDGSIDGSADICKKYAEKYTWIKYFHKENGGVSSARNFGIEQATGDFVWFVDIDDEIGINAIESIVSSPTAELSVFNFSVQDGNKIKESCLHNKEGYVSIADKNTFFNEYVFLYQLNNALWNKIFNLDIIKANNIRFNPFIKIGEDFLFSLLYYKAVNQVYFSRKSIYCYYIHNGSAMKSKNSEVFHYQRAIAESVKEIYKKDVSPIVMEQFLLVQFVCGINQSKERGVDKQEIKKYKKEYMQTVMEGKAFSRQTVHNFLKSEGAGFLSKIKFKLSFIGFCELF